MRVVASTILHSVKVTVTEYKLNILVVRLHYLLCIYVWVCVYMWRNADGLIGFIINKHLYYIIKVYILTDIILHVWSSFNIESQIAHKQSIIIDKCDKTYSSTSSSCVGYHMNNAIVHVPVGYYRKPNFFVPLNRHSNLSRNNVRFRISRLLLFLI